MSTYRIPKVETRVYLKETGEIYSQQIRNPSDLASIFVKELSDLDRENVVVINLNVKMQPINMHTVSIGNISQACFNLSNVFKTAILSNAASIIIAHNHPSGDAEPSEEDLKLTKRIAKAGKLLGIELIDHVVIGKDYWISIKEYDPKSMAA